MKKILFTSFILYILSSFNSISFANLQIETPIVEPSYSLKGGVVYEEDETIYLDKDIQHPALNIKPVNTIVPVYTPVLNGSRIEARRALARASKLTGEEYYIAPIFNYVKESAGNFSYGTFYSAAMDSAQMTYSTNLFSRYDGKHYALTGLISSDSQSIDGAYKGMLGIAPEIKLTKSLSIKDTMKAYMGVPVKKNQISLIYTPQFKKYVDSLRLELGASQSFYENGATNSAVEFSTKFKL